MTENTLVCLADRLNDARMSTPQLALLEALEDIGERGAFKDGKELLILALDRGEDDEKYSISFRQAGMSMSECIGLCEIAKTLFLTEMDYIPGFNNE